MANTLKIKLNEVNRELRKLDTVTERLSRKRDKLERKILLEKAKSVVGKCFRYVCKLDSRASMAVVDRVTYIKVLRIERVYYRGEYLNQMVYETVSPWRYNNHYHSLSDADTSSRQIETFFNIDWARISPKTYDKFKKEHGKKSKETNSEWVIRSGWSEYRRKNGFHQNADEKKHWRKVERAKK